MQVFIVSENLIIPSAIGYHELQIQNMIKHYGGGVLRLVYKYILVIEPAWGEKNNSLPAENNKNRSLIPQQQFPSSNQLQTKQTN